MQSDIINHKSSNQKLKVVHEKLPPKELIAKKKETITLK